VDADLMKNHRLSWSEIDEKITLRVEAWLMKSQCKWKREWWS